MQDGGISNTLAMGYTKQSVCGQTDEEKRFPKTDSSLMYLWANYAEAQGVFSIYAQPQYITHITPSIIVLFLW